MKISTRPGSCDLRRDRWILTWNFTDAFRRTIELWSRRLEVSTHDCKPLQRWLDYVTIESSMDPKIIVRGFACCLQHKTQVQRVTLESHVIREPEKTAPLFSFRRCSNSALLKRTYQNCRHTAAARFYLEWRTVASIGGHTQVPEMNWEKVLSNWRTLLQRPVQTKFLTSRLPSLNLRVQSRIWIHPNHHKLNEMFKERQHECDILLQDWGKTRSSLAACSCRKSFSLKKNAAWHFTCNHVRHGQAWSIRHCKR